jgi:transposase
MTRKKRTSWLAEEKLRIVLTGIQGDIEVSELCRREGMNPTRYYGWQRQFFENGVAAFQKTRRRQVDRRDQKMEKLEANLARKNEVLAELMQEHVEPRKEVGEL